eukprot:7538685-Prorocentrum_lima.AAC.1
MQASLGYQPGLHPDSDQGDAHCEDDMYGGVSRHTHRLGGIALQEVMEVIAQKRMERALASKTRKAVQLEEYNVGDIV